MPGSRAVPVIGAWLLASPPWLVACALAVPTVATAFVARRQAHWGLLPIWACGVVALWRLLDEVVRSGSLLRSASVVWGFLVHFLFVAPLWHLERDFWLRWVRLPPDFRPWMGRLALLTLGGLVLMTCGERLAARLAWPPRLAARVVSPGRFLLVGAALAAVSLGGGVLVYRHFGGFSGFVSAFERGLDSFRGFGPLIVVAEGLPLLLAAVALGLLGGRPWFASAGLPLLVLFAATQFAVAGLRGSRGNTLFAIVWALVAWNRLVRPVRLKVLLPLGAAALAFLFFYGFYKSMGRRAFEGSLTGETIRSNVKASGRSIDMLALLDLGRFDVQSYLLYRHAGPARWRLALGRTYLGGLLSPVPGSWLPDKPATKVREGTEALYGPDWKALLQRPASNQYGLAGEAILNFGPAAVPLAYGLFGLVLGLVSRLEGLLGRRDPRWLLLAFAPGLLWYALLADSDNVTLALLQSFLFLGPLVWLGTRSAPAGSPGEERAS